MSASPSRLKMFLSRIFWELAEDSLSFVKPLKYCYIFYECFYLAPHTEQVGLIQEAQQLDLPAVREVVQATLADSPFGVSQVSDRATLGQVASQLISGLRNAGKAAEQGINSAEALRLSLNRYLTTHGGQPMAIPQLTPEQRSLGRLFASSVLAPKATVRAVRGAGTPPKIPGYSFLGPLGSGGFADVYLMQHDGSGERHAVKVIRHIDDPRRLEREIKTLREVQNESHLVGYRADGKVGSIVWIAMEYVGGLSLAQMLALPGIRPTTDQALVLGEQMLLGLSALHKRRLMHRDLKPDNIMIDGQYRLRLIDFGLAKPFLSSGQSTQVTQTATILGTISYMPPEQLAGEIDLTPTADVWSFAVVLYELLTGQLPYRGLNIVQQDRAINAAKVNLDHPGIPSEIREILQRCFVRKANERVDDAIGALAAYLPRAAEARRRLRHERFQASWISVLKQGLLEKFAAKHTARVPVNAVDLFSQMTVQHGITEIDDIRLREILPPIFTEQGKVASLEASLQNKKRQLERQAAALSPEQIQQVASELLAIHEQIKAAKQGVNAVVRQTLAQEVAAWQDLQAAEERRRIQLEQAQAEHKRQQEQSEAAEKQRQADLIAKQAAEEKRQRDAQVAEDNRRRHANQRIRERWAELLYKEAVPELAAGFAVIAVLTAIVFILAYVSVPWGRIEKETRPGIFTNYEVQTYPEYNHLQRERMNAFSGYACPFAGTLVFLWPVIWVILTGVSAYRSENY